MRIAYFVWEYPPLIVGGLGTYASQMVPQLELLGNTIDVFTINDGSLNRCEKKGNIQIHRPILLRGAETLKKISCEELKKWGDNGELFNKIFSYNYLSASKFISELSKKEKYDLVVVNDWLSAISGLLIKENMDMPVVFHVHSTEQQRSGGGSELIRGLEREMYFQSDLVITVSKAMKEHLISIGCPEEKLNSVWNGCVPEEYSEKRVNSETLKSLIERYDIRDDEKIALFVGRLTSVKGAVSLVKGFPKVLKEFPNTKLIILGMGEDEGEISRIIKEQGMEDKVRLRTEFVSVEERITHYALADLCVFPSTSEPFGLVSLEAMCMERPIVVGASGISGFREQVIPEGPEQTGVHVDGNSSDDIAWGIKELLGDWEEAIRMGKRGRKRAEKIFNIKKVAQDTNFLYEEAAGI